MVYTEKIVDHYEQPRNIGSFPKTDVNVGTGVASAPAHQDLMTVQIRVNPTTKVISDARFKTSGSNAAIASSSYLTELVKGMKLDEAARVKATDIAHNLSLPPVRGMCALPLPNLPSPVHAL
jgi:nitrogen fixation NifU-like protein